MKVIVVESNDKKPFIKEVDGSLESLQAIVGGYIECIQLGSGITLVCNEEGKLIDLPPNRVVCGDIICGSFFITKTDYSNGEFIDLSEEEQKMVMRDFTALMIW